ncbi:MAG: SAM-dependent methyltransferase, partial [Desulfobulbia bacterium]
MAIEFLAMFTPLKYLLNKIVEAGDLHVIDASGKSHKFGDGSGKPVVSRICDKNVEFKLAINPALYLGESYM